MTRFPNCKNLMSKCMWNCKVITERQNNMVGVCKTGDYTKTTLHHLSAVCSWFDYISSCHLKTSLWSKLLTCRGAGREGDKYLTTLPNLLWVSSVAVSKDWMDTHQFLGGLFPFWLWWKGTGTQNSEHCVFPCLLYCQSRISVSAEDDLASFIHIKFTWERLFCTVNCRGISCH